MYILELILLLPNAACPAGQIGLVLGGARVSRIGVEVLKLALRLPRAGFAYRLNLILLLCSTNVI